MQLLVLVGGSAIVATVTWFAVSWWRARHDAGDVVGPEVVIERPAGQLERQ